eukprot:CCRYP_000675-RA/>CCRYP_000675-RA protein AED:0.46 eAED:0.46 QI:0/0/0/1/0/0/2/0/111
MQAATQSFPRDILSAILDTDTSALLEYCHLIKNSKYCTIWKNSHGKELGRLAQGIPDTVQGTNTYLLTAEKTSCTEESVQTTYLRKMTHITSASGWWQQNYLSWLLPHTHS